MNAKLLKASIHIFVLLILGNFDAHSQWVEAYSGRDNIDRLFMTRDTVTAGTLGNLLFLDVDSHRSTPVRRLSLPVEDAIIYATCIDDVLYAATHNDRDSGGLYRSTDHGDTWQFVLRAEYINSVVAIGSSLFAGGFDCIYRSNDGGDTWEDACVGLSHPVYVRYLATIGNIVFAAMYHDLYKTTDVGDTWIPASKGLEYALQYSFGVSTLVSVDSILFVGYPKGGGGGAGIYRSTDLGNSWVPIIDNIHVFDMRESPLTARGVELFSTGHYLMASLRDMGVYLSKDYGMTWRRFIDGLPDPSQNFARPFTTDDTYIYATLDLTYIWKRPIADLVSPDQR